MAAATGGYGSVSGVAALAGMSMIGASPVHFVWGCLTPRQQWIMTDGLNGP
jgi:hypothetical protein